MKREKLRPEFVEFVPSALDDGVLYISVEYATAVHLCCCGCARKVVTPISQADWALIFEGDVVSLTPSIGNWSFDCEAHYWIRKNQVRWASKMTPAEIHAGRERDRERTERYFAHPDEVLDDEVASRKNSWLTRFGRRLLRVIGR